MYLFIFSLISSFKIFACNIFSCLSFNWEPFSIQMFCQKFQNIEDILRLKIRGDIFWHFFDCAQIGCSCKIFWVCLTILRNLGVKRLSWSSVKEKNQCKSMNWFLYERNLHHKRVKRIEVRQILLSRGNVAWLNNVSEVIFGMFSECFFFVFCFFLFFLALESL